MFRREGGLILNLAVLSLTIVLVSDLSGSMNMKKLKTQFYDLYHTEQCQ